MALQMLQHEVDRLQRRQRGIARENPAIVGAFRRTREHEFETAREQRRALADINNTDADRKRKYAELHQVNDKLAKASRDLLHLDNIRQERQAASRITPEYLGKGAKKIGGTEGRLRRNVVLDKLVALGDTLPPHQRNEFGQFKVCLLYTSPSPRDS